LIRYNFTRFRAGKEMAEGVAVHADSLEAATAKARAMLDNPAESIRFDDNQPCVPALNCAICRPRLVA
jgi:hypothetical protein